MENFCWKDEYSIGVEKLDHQHQHLFEIINKLIEQPGSSGDSTLVPEILTELVNYTREHFTDEEELIQEYGYPELEQHKKQHNYFIDTTAELSISFVDNKQTTIYEITEFLKLWLTTHILKTDMKYKKFFMAKIL